jgi:hypothetical protein
MAISDYSTTAASNTTIASIDVSGTTGKVKDGDNVMRAMAADMKAGLITGYTTTATAAGTTTLTVASNSYQYFTGTTTQTITMPVTSTLELGRTWIFVNESTGILTVNSSGSNLITTVGAGETVTVQCILLTGTSAASWNVLDSPILGFSGTVSLPGLHPAGDTNTGLYPIGADNIGVAANGAKVLDISATGLGVTGTLISSGAVKPAANDGAALGASGTAFSDLFLASGAVINADAGNAVITHSSGIWTVSTGDLRVTTAGTNAASVVTVGGAQTLTNKTLTSPTMTTPTLGVAAATSININGGGAVGALLSGTYTPTLTNETNAAASVASVTMYYRIGNMVTVAGRVQITNLAGVGASSDVYYFIAGDGTNNRATFTGVPASNLNRSVYFQFTYEVL